MFVLTFATHVDKDRILDGRLWLFDNALYALRSYDGIMQPSKIPFVSEVFWMQIHNLPLGQMRRDFGVFIGETVGTILDVDTKEDGVGWGKYLKVKIELPLHKPIACGCFMNSFGTKLWVDFKNEKLPKLCFKCGWLLHVASGYQNENVYMSREGGDVMQYGAWLRAKIGF